MGPGRGGAAAAALVALLLSVAAASAASEPDFDAAPFGEPLVDASGRSVGVRWAEPRKVTRVAIEFEGAPPASFPRVEYWRQHWNGCASAASDVGFADAVRSADVVGFADVVRSGDVVGFADAVRSGDVVGFADAVRSADVMGFADAVRSADVMGLADVVRSADVVRLGWSEADDWYGGRWVPAATRLEQEGSTWIFRLEPMRAEEPELECAVGHRRTLKLRVDLGARVRPLPRLRVYTESVLEPVTVRVELGAPRLERPRAAGPVRGELEVANGRLAALRATKGLRTRGANGFELAGETGKLVAELLVAHDGRDPHSDRPRLTLRLPGRSFSVDLAEVADGRRVLVDDLGALVARADDALGLAEARAEARGRTTVHRRVFAREEQSLQAARAALPPKPPLAFVHGLPGNRNVMRQHPDGNVEIASDARWFRLDSSPRDSDRKRWNAERLLVRFGIPGALETRERLDGVLPILVSRFRDGDVLYELTSALDAVSGSLEDPSWDEPSVLFAGVRIRNASRTRPAEARLEFSAAVALPRPGGEDDELELHDRPLAHAAGEAVVVEQDAPVYRFSVDTGGAGACGAEDGVASWRLSLEPGAAHELKLVVPSITLSTPELRDLAERGFEAVHERVAAFWRRALEQGTRLRTGEPALDAFHRAHLGHLLVNGRKAPGSERRYAHVGSFLYGVYPSESALVIAELDRRGLHDEAERHLESFLRHQGEAPLPGQFTSTEGLFYASGGHEMGGYNRSHGAVMDVMAEHWFLTRDRRWMARAAPGLVAAAEWVIRERRATRERSGIERGLLPAGPVEDVGDQWHWFTTNGVTWRGLERVAAALGDFAHPEAARLSGEAEAFRHDLSRALEEARVRTPVVALRDGTWVPKVPSHAHARGRTAGFIREVLEGGLPLVTTGLIPPDSEEARWVIEDYEDNLYPSAAYGYPLADFEAGWFSRSGFGPQANLLPGPLAYLQRDEVRHFLRAFFNAFASGFHPDVVMLHEHALPSLADAAGDHFKTSDEAQALRSLRLMFVAEQGDELRLGQALPRRWLEDGRELAIEDAATHFGPVSFRVRSRAASGTIEVVLDPPRRNPPRRLRVRVRHPEAKRLRSVALDGRPHVDFDPEAEAVTLPGDLRRRVELTLEY